MIFDVRGVLAQRRQRMLVVMPLLVHAVVQRAVGGLQHQPHALVGRGPRRACRPCPGRPARLRSAPGWSPRRPRPEAASPRPSTITGEECAAMISGLSGVVAAHQQRQPARSGRPAPTSCPLRRHGRDRDALADLAVDDQLDARHRHGDAGDLPGHVHRAAAARSSRSGCPSGWPSTANSSSGP